MIGDFLNEFEKVHQDGKFEVNLYNNPNGMKELEELNRMMFRQQQKIDLLQAQIRELYQLMQAEAPDDPRNPRDEIPPHY